MTISMHTTMSSRNSGAPDVSFGPGIHELQIYPTGVGQGPCLFMSIEDWRALNAAVEKAIAERADADTPEQLVKLFTP